MSEDTGPIYKRITYKEWLKIMEETIRDSQMLLSYYVEMYNRSEEIAKNLGVPSLADAIKKNYENKIIRQLETLLDTLDIYNMGKMFKNKGEYFIELTSYSPAFYYVSKTMRKYLKLDTSHI